MKQILRNYIFIFLRYSLRSIVPTLFLVGLVISLRGQNTLVFTPIQDNTLYQTDDGSQSNGIGENFFVGQNAQANIRRGVIQFDFSEGFPTDATISVDSVALTLHMSRANAEGPDTTNIGIHKLLSSWGEGPSQAGGQQGQGLVSQEGDATWLHRFFPDTLWNEIGGDFTEEASAISGVPEQSGTFVTWTGEGLVEDVQNWINNPDENFGWLLKGGEEDGETQSARRFDTREIAQDSLKPQLFVSFSITTSRKPKLSELGIDVFPNPSTGNLNVSVSNVQSNSLQLVVRNLIGNELNRFSFTPNQGKVSETLRLGDLSAGIYFIQFSTDSKRETRRIVIR